VLDNPFKYRVACFKKDEAVGVGIERYRIENDQAVTEYIGSFHIGNASRKETVKFYVNEIINQHGPDDALLIRIADNNLRNKQEWLADCPDRVKFNIESSGKFKTCQMMAADACIRGFSINENL
jgi:hypothetical protein